MDSTGHSSPNNDGAVRNFVIRKDVHVNFRRRMKSPPKLEVTLNERRVTMRSENAEVVDDGTHVWTLENEIPVFSDDVVTFHLTYSIRKIAFLPCLPRGDNVEELPIAYEEIAAEFKGQEQGISFHSQDFDVILKVAEGRPGDMIKIVAVGLEAGSLDPLLPERVQGVIDSSESFLRFTNAPLKSVLGSIPVSEEALQAIEEAIKKLGTVHPLAKAVLTALSIPYDFLKNEREFKKEVNDLLVAMQSSCSCLFDVQDHMKIKSAKDHFISIMKILRDAALYVYEYRRKSRLGQVIGAQFSTELKLYSDKLRMEKDEFLRAMVVQVVCDVDKIASTTDKDLLRERLGPVTHDDDLKCCLEGTRVTILKEAREWIMDVSAKNILWISGSPGAGKSTIAGTLALDFADVCATFFCKRDTPALRNPRRIWSTLAYRLSNQHTEVGDALTQTLKSREGGAWNDPIQKQFNQLIKGPLETELSGKHFGSSGTSYPLIIIDALDECFLSGNEDFDELLESFDCWAQLPPRFKLVITSRSHADIDEKLSRVSHCINLAIGDEVSEESKQDVQIFFTEKFRRIQAKPANNRLSSDWPGETILQELTDFAAGLFIWADMVVKYVGLRTGGSNPIKRLDVVLSDIRPRPGDRRGKGTSDRVDRLYARIIFEALRRSEPAERDMAKRILATIMLAKEPLGKDEVIELLSANSADTREVLLFSVDSTLQELTPIIPSRAKLRVCHKTVTDFLLSHDRSAAALRNVIENWNTDLPQQRWNTLPSDLVLDCQLESWRLAVACVQFVCRKFTLDLDPVKIASLLQQSTGLFFYANQNWVCHIEDAGLDWTPVLANIKGLANALQIVYRSLTRYITERTLPGDEAKALTKSLQETTCLASELLEKGNSAPDLNQELIQCINKLDNTRGEFQIAMIVNLACRNVRKSSTNLADDFLRRRLQPSGQTSLDSECLKGTRSSVRRRAKEWLEDPDGRTLLWISGAPGAGKSALATTLANEFSESRLCAKVFVKRDIAERRDPTRIWNTLAFDLAALNLGLKGNIMEMLLEKSHDSTDPLDNQLRFRSYILKALEEQPCLPVVFLVDALDECYTKGNEHGEALLESLTGWADLPRTHKLVITSRDIPNISKALAGVSTCVNLQAKDEELMEEIKLDVQLTFRTKLAEILKDLEDSRTYWLQPDVIQQLVEHASGSFIWVTLALQMVKLNPRTRLDDILNNSKRNKARNVDALYANVLFGVLGQLNDVEREVFRSALAFIVLAKDPFQEVVLVDLLSKVSPTEEICQRVENMAKEFSSIISVGENQLLRIPHKSFVDFLLEGNRCLKAMERLLPKNQAPRSYITLHDKDSANITLACLLWMDSELRFNVCRIESSHTLNGDIPDLEMRISENISLALIYACRFWAEHLKDCKDTDQQFRLQVDPLLKTLLENNLLYLLEIFSLIGDLASAKTSLKFAAAVLLRYDDELAVIAKDGSRFVEMFEKPIAAATPHIYLTGLPFCPSNSRIAKIYGPQYPNLLSVDTGRLVDWDDTSVEILRGRREKLVTSLAFFPDGTKIVSGSTDCKVRVWDARTGRAVAKPFTGHGLGSDSQSIECVQVAVSPDGSQIASGDSHGFLRIWDSNTGACPLGSIHTSASRHESMPIAFSPDGSCIATGSSDYPGTLKVWNVTTGKLCLGPLVHGGGVDYVAFSPDGTTIRSLSVGATIRIWDAHTGDCRMELRIGRDFPHLFIKSFAFSTDERYMASVSGYYPGGEGNIYLWDIAKGFARSASVTTGSSEVQELVSFSPDGTCLASASGHGIIRFWDVESGKLELIEDLIYPDREEYNDLSVVAFSPDGLSVAAGSCASSSIKLWAAPSSFVDVAGTRNVDISGQNSSSSGVHLDAHGHVAFSNESYVDEAFWMHTSRKDKRRLFWVPEENRESIWRPRNTCIIHDRVTKLDFSRFVHGDKWTECRGPLNAD